jgi:hypothetical protein
MRDRPQARLWWGAAGAALAGCFLASTRPAITPLIEAPTVELELGIPDATRRVAEALRADSIPVSRTEVRDGWLETPWFDAATGVPTGSPQTSRQVGPEVVRVRGWMDPGRPGHTDVTVETVYHRVVDPSRTERALDRIAPPDNPAAVRVKAVLDSLVRRYGEPPPPPPPPADTTAQPSTRPAPSDSTRPRLPVRDSVIAPPPRTPPRPTPQGRDTSTHR